MATINTTNDYNNFFNVPYGTLVAPVSTSATTYSGGSIAIKNDMEEKKVKILYEVIVVSGIDFQILVDTKVVAENQREAEFKAEIDKVLREKNLTPADVTILVNSLGNVKVRKE